MPFKAESRTIVAGFDHLTLRAVQGTRARAVTAEPAADGAEQSDPEAGQTATVQVPTVGPRGGGSTESNVWMSRSGCQIAKMSEMKVEGSD